MKKNILVTGGAGYVGSHMVKCLEKAGYQPVVVDDLSQGRREAVKAEQLHVFNLNDEAALEALFQEKPIAAAMHFAGFIQVGESVALPGKYYENNVSNTVRLLDAMARHKIDKFIFSSTAAVYGDPQYVPIDEAHPKSPVNPYGQSKWMVEQILADYEQAYGLKSIALRYFNAAGADPDGELGECHDPETHLIPLILQVASGRRDAITIFGKDYDTPDGTCVRDYIHVQDLCDAHLLALEALLSGGESGAYNLGNGNGYSVAEVIKAVEKVIGREIKQIAGERRAGDPPVLVADSKLAKEKLGWNSRFDDLGTIIRHAWAWEQKYFGWQG